MYALLKTLGNALWKSIDVLYSLVSLEVLLTWFQRANGGTVIFLRTFAISALICLLALGARNVLDPERIWKFSLREFQMQLVEIGPFFAACFAGVYAALYARFSSQWAYLSGLFNDIKSAQVQESDGHPSSASALSDWKAAFIEDAVALHLAYKPEFASVIAFWGEDPEVRKSFEKNAPKKRRSEFAAIMARVDKIHNV
jgi:hypothetical protein